MTLTDRLEELRSRLTAYILKTAPVTLDKLTEVATAKGFTELEVLNALESVHRDRRIAQTANAAGVITYTLAVAKTAKEPGSHLTYVRNNYPVMDETNDGSGIDIDLSWMFLKTREERDAYKAAASGRPVYNKNNGKKRYHT